MKGSSRTGRRIAVIALFAGAFVTAAVIVFGAAAAVGSVARAQVGVGWRVTLAGGLLITFALLDVFGIRRKSYCSLGWKRQTPRMWTYRHGALGIVAWGFDTGLAVTTFRVAATTWGALSLAALGFSSPWGGIAYGCGFIVPMAFLLAVSLDIPRLQWLSLQRPVVQGVSALFLAAIAAVFLTQLV